MGRKAEIRGTHSSQKLISESKEVDTYLRNFIPRTGRYLNG